LKPPVAAREVSRPLAVQTRLGRYELIARIATGGMGEIFLARLDGAAGFQKLFVIKRILPHLAQDQRFRAMLIAEASIAANMSHANICHVYELDETDGQLYIVMEYLEGVTLLALLRKCSRSHVRLGFDMIAGIVQQVSEGLHYAHELRDRDGKPLGVVHRDVTPSNIFLTETGIVKVHDFGIAKVESAAATDAGAVKGKHAYMAPEQLRGKSIDRRADVFALGVVIHELITGRHLFQRKTDYLTFKAVMDRPLPDLREVREDTPPTLMEALERALAIEADDRFPTVRQLNAAVQGSLAGQRVASQADLAELLHAHFSDELAQHHTEISSVVNRPAAGTQRMPVILQSPSDPDASDYLAVETNVEDEVPPGVTQPEALAVAGTTPSQRPPSHRRRVMGILGLAAGCLAIGLFVIERRDRGSAPAVMVNDPYSVAIAVHQHELDACVARSDASTLEAQAKLTIDRDGHATELALDPSIAGSVRECVRATLLAIVFPAAGSPRELHVTVALHR